jgi:hypothetical protein
MTGNNPLDEDKLPDLEVNQINEALSFFVFFHWVSMFVNAMFCLPVLGDTGSSVVNSERSIMLIFFLVTALNAVIVSCASLDINDLKAFVLVPNM